MYVFIRGHTYEHVRMGARRREPLISDGSFALQYQSERFSPFTDFLDEFVDELR